MHSIQGRGAFTARCLSGCFGGCLPQPTQRLGPDTSVLGMLHSHVSETTQGVGLLSGASTVTLPHLSKVEHSTNAKVTQTWHRLK